MRNLKLNSKKSTGAILTTLLAPIALIASAGTYVMNHTVAKSASDIASVSTPYHIKANDYANQPLNPVALKQGLKAYHWAIAQGKVSNKSVLTIVDFTLPSNKRRMYVVDPKSGKVLANLHTAQGKNSGVTYATKFSNKPNSDQSSLGVYVTSTVYNGKHGMSERLIGLEKGLNSNALARAVVIHAANYVTPSFVKAHGRAGRSWGCFALNPARSHELINMVKGGSVLFAYAPEENHDPNFS